MNTEQMNSNPQAHFDDSVDNQMRVKRPVKRQPSDKKEGYCIVYNCSGKAVSRLTYQYHRKADEELHIHRNNEQLEARSDEGSGEGGIVSKETVCCVGGKVKH